MCGISHVPCTHAALSKRETPLPCHPGPSFPKSLYPPTVALHSRAISLYPWSQWDHSHKTADGPLIPSVRSPCHLHFAYRQLRRACGSVDFPAKVWKTVSFSLLVLGKGCQTQPAYCIADMPLPCPTSSDKDPDMDPDLWIDFFLPRPCTCLLLAACTQLSPASPPLPYSLAGVLVWALAGETLPCQPHGEPPQLPCPHPPWCCQSARCHDGLKNWVLYSLS